MGLINNKTYFESFTWTQTLILSLQKFLIDILQLDFDIQWPDGLVG